MRQSPSNPVRLAVVGLGAMGREHARAIARAADDRLVLAAVADVNAAAAAHVGQELGVPHFSDAQAVLDRQRVDAVLVATPHYLHAPVTIRAARAGIHVLCEKPLAVEVGAARAMVHECQRHGVALGTMFQFRRRALATALKRIIEEGQLGTIHQMTLTCSSWYRSQAYYDDCAWRGTWAGEGGGILLNQATHHLDLVQWLMGRPRRISAFLDTRLHRIEVENTANILCQFDGGAAAYLYFTTAECPRSEQIRVCGDKGMAVADASMIRLARLAEPLSHHIHNCPENRADFIPEPACSWEKIPLSPEADDLRLAVIRQFADHLLGGGAMVATGDDGAAQVEFTNAAYLSGFTHQAVEMPMNENHCRQVRELLERLTAQSSYAGPNLRAEAAAQLEALLAKAQPRAAVPQ